MVHCVKCGAANPDDAEFCNKCGSSMRAVGDSRRVKRKEDECFGLPRGGSIFGLFIGAVIVIAGMIFLLEEYYGIQVELWPFIVIIFGVLVLAGALYGLRRG